MHMYIYVGITIRILSQLSGNCLFVFGKCSRYLKLYDVSQEEEEEERVEHMLSFIETILPSSCTCTVALQLSHVVRSSFSLLPSQNTHGGSCLLSLRKHTCFSLSASPIHSLSVSVNISNADFYYYSSTQKKKIPEAWRN